MAGNGKLVLAPSDIPVLLEIALKVMSSPGHLVDGLIDNVDRNVIDLGLIECSRSGKAVNETICFSSAKVAAAKRH
jgi:hypothetical protein